MFQRHSKCALVAYTAYPPPNRFGLGTYPEPIIQLRLDLPWQWNSTFSAELSPIQWPRVPSSRSTVWAGLSTDFINSLYASSVVGARPLGDMLEKGTSGDVSCCRVKTVHDCLRGDIIDKLSHGCVCDMAIVCRGSLRTLKRPSQCSRGDVRNYLAKGSRLVAMITVWRENCRTVGIYLILRFPILLLVCPETKESPSSPCCKGF